MPKRQVHQHTWQLPLRVSPWIQSWTRWTIVFRFALIVQLLSFRCNIKQKFQNKLFQLSDTRRDLCYSQYRDGQCSNPTSTAVTKSSCCCCTVILGQPMGWGSTCQPCPLPDSSEFEALCPHGAGMTYNGDGNCIQLTMRKNAKSLGNFSCLCFSKLYIILLL